MARHAEENHATNWEDLPEDVQIASVVPRLVGKEARLVCQAFNRLFCSNVTKIVIPRACLQTTGSISRLAKHFPNVVRVQLSGSRNCTFPRAPLTRALDDLFRLPALRHLDLSCVNLTSAEKGVLFKHLADASRSGKLQQLTLSCNVIGPEGAEALERALVSGTHLSLRRLNLRKTVLGDNGAAHIAALLQATHLASLRHLNLSCACILSQGIMHLSSALRSGTHLTNLVQLDLGGNSLFGSGIEHLSATLGSSLHLRSLRHLGLSSTQTRSSGMVALTQALQQGTHLTNLRRLDLCNCGIRDAGVVPFAEALQSCQHLSGLQDVGLSGNYIDAAMLPFLQRRQRNPPPSYDQWRQRWQGQAGSFL